MTHTVAPTVVELSRYILDIFPGNNESGAATVKDDIGEEELLPEDKLSLEFLEKIKCSFITKGTYENCTIYDSFNLAWSLLRILSKEMLNRIPQKVIQEFYARREIAHGTPELDVESDDEE
ncbi:Vacuolar ATP synthase subunit B [Coemansia furcata]|nr:Vacuolar ATP synthase subunit B [Coemansia furcata]